MPKLLQCSKRIPNWPTFTKSSRLKPRGRAITSAILFGLAMVSSAQTVSITEYPLPPGLELPQGIATGPDGALWLTSNRGIGRINTAAVVTNTYPIGSVSGVPSNAGSSITVGPDGALWFNLTVWEGLGSGGAVGRITTAGVLTQYGATAANTLMPALTVGPDGTLWFSVTPCSSGCHGATGNSIGRMTATGVLTDNYNVPTIYGGPVGITSGPDGALWFVESGGNKVGRITTAGVVTEYPIPTASSLPVIIVAGPDGALWFTESSSNQIGRITTAGVVTEYHLPTAASGPGFITAGPDGALWFVESAANQIGRITTAGAITEYPIPTARSSAGSITSGPDGALWFTEGAANKIGRVSLSGESLGIGTASPLPAGAVGTPYAQSLAATGGTGPYIWSATGLPLGLILSNSGALSGTPASSGTFTVAINLQDSSSPKLRATRVFTLVINSGGPLAILTSSTLPGGTAGTAYSYNLSAAGGTPPYTWSVVRDLPMQGTLPTGFILNAGTGLISGTPTVQGSSTFTIQVTDSASATASLALGLSIAAAGSDASNPVRTGVLSQVVSGGGWNSSVYFYNSSPSSVNVTLNFWADDGTPLSLPLAVTQTGGSRSLNAPSLNAGIAPNATVLVEIGSESNVSLSGWAEVLSSAPIQGYGVFHYTSTAGIQSEGTVPLETTFQPSFLMPYDNLNGFQTAVALANLATGTPATVAATIWDENGTQLAVQTIKLAASGHTSFISTDVLPATTANRGIIQFRSISGGNITGLGLRVDPLGGFTSIPKSPSPQ